MSSNRWSWIAVAGYLLVLFALPAAALQPRVTPARFDGLVKPSPAAVVAGVPVAADALPAADARRERWAAFSDANGGWRVHLDARTGLPALAAGRGIPWLGESEAAAAALDPSRLERLARAFLDRHVALLGAWSDQLAFDAAASGRVGEHAWRVSFRQVVDGVPVDAARFDFDVVRGNLVAFGATRWATVRRGTTPRLDEEAARAALYDYLGRDRTGDLVPVAPPRLELLPVAAGAALDHALAWRLSFRVPGEPATWVAEIDADDGRILGLWDDTRYDRVTGGVYPISDDQVGPSGTEQPGFPLPFADISINNGAPITANDAGMFACSSGSTKTTLSSTYINVHDNCGPISETSTCGATLALLQGPGTDCVVPAGHSAGDTHAARSSFYHLNRSMQKGRAWLPDNNWLKSQVTDNVNIDSTCNAFWNGSVNFYKSGGGCRNTGEIMGVFVHEWGHGLDSNDGGGYDNPSEAYADIVALFETRESCVGRGFFMNGNCSGYGDACLDCTGIRDQDWDKHAEHAPATPVSFIRPHCGGGGDGPCGGEGHCESYLAGEAVFDLATRDLPASGLDAASAWQLAERLFYQSRKGSGGDAYNCAMPNSDSCGTGTWFHRMRVADDDDGDLSNGTPHAAALYNAFSRHAIACGAPDDPSNASHSACPALAQPFVAAKDNGNDSVTVTWTPVAGAARYRILRNDIGCDRGQIVIDTADGGATSSYVDADAPSGFAMFYRVQALAANAACESPVSDCGSSAPVPAAGTVALDRATYPCSATAAIEVVDGNVGAGTVTVSVSSTTETVPETVTLTQTLAGSGKYRGSIALAGGPASHGDGKLAVASGDTVTVRYLDANDGAGGHDVPVVRTALVDCQPPVISNVRSDGVSDVAATIRWTTSEASDSTVVWGMTVPPAATQIGAAHTTDHTVGLNGLAACTVYWYEVRSTDAALNTARDDNGGTWYHFETLGDFGAGLQGCHAGEVRIDRAAYACTDSVTFTVSDMDLNADPARVDTAIVVVTSGTEPAGERVVVTETGANTSRFTGSIATAAGAPAPDGTLQVRGGDLVTVTYFDADDGSGRAATSFATATVDCAGPAISNLRVESITDQRAVIRFTTGEPGDTVVEWGPTPSLGQTSRVTTLATDHAVAVNRFTDCQAGWFRVRTTDQFGNTTALDAGGTPFRFSTGLIPGLYWHDTFENGNTGWTLEGEWQIGAPQGKGGWSGRPDPTVAYNNARVLGHDLTGLGTYKGDYEPNTYQAARSPVLDATTWTNTKLMFYRRLQSGAGDDARIQTIVDGRGSIAWRSQSQRVDDVDYVYQTYGVSQADGHAQVQIEFSQFTDSSGAYSGWNIDDVIFKDGSKPDFDACRQCAGTPSFAGAKSAIDNNPCGASGVTVSWDRAASWGTGGTGRYDVYRGTAPGFPADAGHLVAGGVNALSYNDATAPVGVLWYLVRAESDEACGGGPANGGVVDDNAVYISVQKTSSRPLPGAVPGLAVTTLAKTHVRLTWASATDATGYNVYRSTTPHPADFARLVSVTGTSYDDTGSAANLQTYFYLVKGTNPCGQEGP